MNRYYLIDLPVTQYTAVPRLLPVLPTSLKRLRSHVERFARYYLRELGAGGVMFEISESPMSLGFVPYKAFLLIAQDRFIGSACFSHREDQDLLTPWLCQWLWIHPYFRRHGVLTHTWPELKRQVGPFRLGKPLSSHMQAFIAKVGHTEA